MSEYTAEAPKPLNEVVTFYSYKGGTGRTMALANVACLFAKRSRTSGRVLAIDWDLEAPGLHYYLRGPSGMAVDPSAAGVLEYFTRVQEILATGAASGSDDEAAAESILDRLSAVDYTRQTMLPNLSLMPAGRLDDTYQARLAKLDWVQIYQRAPALFRRFARRLAKEYDVVLIDSRTGMTDISGICTTLMPDKLVVVFSTNQQSLVGIERLVRTSVEYRQGSRDVRPLLIYPLPSRIDSERDKLRLLWRHGDSTLNIEGFQPQLERTFRDAYGLQTCDLSIYCNEVQVQHSPEYAYGEEIAALDVLEADRFSIVRSYDALVQWLSTSAAPWETPGIARRRKQIEGLIEREAGLLRQGRKVEFRQLVELQSQIVDLAIVTRPGHSETIEAIHRLIRTYLTAPTQSSALAQAAGLIKALTRRLPSLRFHVMVKALSAIFEGTQGLRVSAAKEEADGILKSTFDALAEGCLKLEPSEFDGLDQLAMALLVANASPEARALQEFLLAARQRVLGEEHKDTIAARLGMAKTLRGQGDLAGARAHEEAVLAARQRLLGEEHPDTLTARLGLAETLRGQGDLAGARAHEEAVLAARQRLLGEEHPDTLTARLGLAETLRGQGDLAGARAHEEAVLAARQRLLGEEHPDTLTARLGLAETLRGQGDLATARAHGEAVLAARLRLLGGEHPDTLTARLNLAETLYAQGDLVGARAHEEAVLLARLRLLGEEHPDTLTARLNLAGTLKTQGDLANARLHQEVVLNARQGLLGEEHPDTLTARLNLATTLYAEGNLTDARAQQEVALASMQRLLREERPDTLTARNNLAVTLFAQGDFAGARKHQESVLAGMEKLFGERHPSTLIARLNLAQTLSALGDLAGARALQEEVLDEREKTLGKGHQDTLVAMTMLAGTLSKMGMLQEAQELRDSALARQAPLT